MYAHVYKIKKWCPTQRTAVTECYVIDQGKFEAMNMLSGRRVSHCDKHQFRAKVTVFEMSSLNVVGFRYCALLHLAVF